jgi:predicted ATP-grasp superfamily ATP-dependent carboligase
VSRSDADSVKRNVLVTDGEQRATLATVRSLGRAGYDVYVCSHRSSSIAGASRFCAGSFRVADPLRDPKLFLSDLLRLATATRFDVLLPMTEAALLVVLPHRDKFTCRIPFANADAFSRICDKREVLKAAGKHGIVVPAQIEIDAPLSVSRLKGELRFPVVIKPSRSVAGKDGARIRAGVIYAGNASELRTVLEHIPRAAYPILLQERIRGPGFGISVLVWNGELLAAFAHRRIREKPPSGGVSVLSESIPLNNDLLSRSLALLSEFRWQGVAMVEYKQDADTGLAYLMEINGRFWGSLQLAIDAGVDFPNLLVEASLEMRPQPVTTYEAGVRLRWEWGDLDHLLAVILHSSTSFAPSRLAGRGRRLAAIREFLRDLGGRQRGEILRSDDPRPFLRETLDWFRRR